MGEVAESVTDNATEKNTEKAVDNPEEKTETTHETDEKGRIEKSDGKYDEGEVEKVKCRNENLAGQEHPVTGVPFEQKEVEFDEKKYEVVAPEFESTYDFQLNEDEYNLTDKEQMEQLNLSLAEAIEEDDGLRDQFTDEQIDQIENGETPDGFVWHHDVEPGKMQLVDREIHEKTGHTGGRSIWGGGSDNR